jgi:hypothetical protein
VALVPLLALAALACGGRLRGSAIRGPDRRAMTRLERQAQQDMGCRSPMHVVALEVRAYQVEGCGQMREYAWTCAGRRCSFTPMVPAMLRASEDLQCAPQQLTAQADTPTHRAFFGCMRGAAYSLLCVDHGCVWSRTQETVAMASPVAAPTSVAVAPLPPPIADPTLEGAVIPPPPGAPSAFSPAAPPPPPPPSTGPSSADTVVVPPPPT